MTCGDAEGRPACRIAAAQRRAYARGSALKRLRVVENGNDVRDFHAVADAELRGDNHRHGGIFLDLFADLTDKNA